MFYVYKFWIKNIKIEMWKIHLYISFIVKTILHFESFIGNLKQVYVVDMRPILRIRANGCSLWRLIYIIENFLFINIYLIIEESLLNGKLWSRAWINRLAHLWV